MQARLQVLKDPKALTVLQRSTLGRHTERLLIYAGSLQFLHAGGLTTEEEWSANKRFLARVLTPCVARYWFATKDTWRGSFALEFNDLIRNDLIESQGIHPNDCEAPE